MEMNASNTNNSANENIKTFPTRSLTPAVLGMTSSHGIKLSQMTSEDKKELMAKLEEWRKARKEKLAATILRKQKQGDSSKVSKLPMPLKPRPVTLGDGNTKPDDKESVFERLYKNNGKVRNSEIKSQQILKPSFRNSVLSAEKANKSVKTFFPEKEKLETLPIANNFDSADNKENQPLPSEEIPEEKFHNELTGEIVEAGKQRSKSGVCVSSEEDFNESLKLTKAKHEEVTETIVESDLGNLFVNEQEKGTETIVESDLGNLLVDDPEKVTESIVKSAPVSKSLPFKGVEPQKRLAVKPLQPKKSFPAKQVEPHQPPKICLMKPAQPQKIKNPIRRSISMTFRQKRRTDFAVRKSVSAKNLLEINLNAPTPNRPSLQTPLPGKETKNDAVAKGVTFVTPKYTKSLTSSHLRDKLESWLKVNGHSLERYRHLRCFGLAKNEKPLSEARAIPSDDSLDNSFYATAPNTPVVDLDMKNKTPITVIPQTDIKDVQNWLKELHRLIIEDKYPSERCEEWLSAIRKKCSNCTQLPIYWECLAALHESKGDIKSAIEDYERAIIKGGEVDAVENSLAQLFDKMVIEQKKHTKTKVEKGIDPKNIFKSTIIKFALQQKALKKLSSEIEPSVRQQLYVATPVRRSTRIQTPYKTKNEVASLENLTPEFRNNVTFKPNESLISGD